MTWVTKHIAKSDLRRRISQKIDGPTIVIDGPPIVYDMPPIVYDRPFIVYDRSPIVVDGPPIENDGHSIVIVNKRHSKTSYFKDT